MNFRNVQPEIKDFPGLKLPDVNSLTLSNGIKLNFYDNAGEKVNRIVVTFPVGLADVDNPATLMILSQLMSEGASKLTGMEISEILDFNGAWLRVTPDNHYFDITLHSINKSLDQLLPIFYDVIYNPLLPEKEFKSICQRLSASADVNMRKVSQIADKKLSQLFFGKSHPIARLPIDSSDYNLVNYEDVKDLHHRIITSLNPEISIAGNTCDIIDMVVSQFHGREINDVAYMQRYVSGCSTDGCRCDITAENATQSAVAIAIPTIPRSHDDYIDLRMAVMGLGGYFGSRLMTEIREKRGMTYGISAQLLGHREGSQIKISAQTSHENVDLLIDAINHEIKRISTDLLSEREMSMLRGHAMTSLASILDSPFSIVDYHATLRRISAPDNYFNLQQAAIKSITSERIAELISKYLKFDKAIIVTAG